MEIIARAVAVYFFIWLVTRGIGKRQLTELSAFQLILLVTIGDLVQQGVTQDDRSITGAFLAVGTIAMLVAITSAIAYFWPKSRQVIEGVPVVVVKDGHVIDDALRTERMPIDDLLEEARREGIDDLRKVKLAIVETDGKLSFIQDKENSSGNGQHSAEKKIDSA
jgi:uncharacterized membrane protein YcaP (DUF421 family)